MTKSGLIEAVAERTPHISKKDTEIVVNTIFDSMATGDPVHISAKRTPFFKVGKELKEMVDDARSAHGDAADAGA
jgi:nucleoid DNA-binding protein